ncbi:MAG: sensor domain-containing phosphodiesterase [Marinobacter sp.]|uniref:putative bifunctional diguanylate cyclase/phosphodiesterase n=1 Tax=Marinobacter sp. TaxID=50741 RepID=UPI00299E0877|nr:sensor domain-containing phosphodiesterase [Marinobacter sp.]MDX1634386.1 sensor domain-containing phosphodiesterase [Marinobacter sp.]
MPDNQTFIEFHETLMRLSHSPEFISSRREKKLAALVEMCSSLLGVERVSVWRLGENHDALLCEVLHQPGDKGAITGPSSAKLSQQEHPSYFEALSARLIEASQALSDPRTRSFRDSYLAPVGIHSMLDAPIFDDGRLSGVFCLEALHPREWSLAELSFVAALADTVSLTNTHVAWLRSKQKLEYLTHFDSLTGLANLQSLRDRMDYLVDKVKRRGSGDFVMVWVDIDRLKAINDGLGPQVGDQVIAETARRLRELQLPGKDQLARIGGDEFALVLRNVGANGMLDDALNRIMAQLSLPINLAEQTLNISVSLGVCHYPGDGDSAETLLRGAEAAMYHAKQQGRAQACSFDTSIQATARSRFALERRLRAAIRDDQLSVFHQPILDAASHTLVSTEALVRWQHPERGWLSPIEFLDVARSAVLMYGLGECVLRAVCHERQQARLMGLAMPVTTINLAAEQVLDPGLPALVQSICKEFEVDQRELHFEVTEDSIQGDSRTLKGVLDQLVAGGSELAIDDFGTGYSSLSRLKHLPFSKLKIDRSFIRDIPDDEDDCAITLSILGLARGLNLSVVAEGVETPGQEHWLKEQGCDFLQGYRYSRPVPFDTLVEAFFKQPTVTAT